MTTTTRQAATLAAALTLALPCAAEPPQQQAPDQGMVVVRDPQTGTFRPPTAAEMRALQSQQQPLQMAPPAQATVRPDGTRAVALGERGMVYSVTKTGPDGKQVSQCVTGQEAAGKALAAPAPASTPAPAQPPQQQQQQAKEHDHDH